MSEQIDSALRWAIERINSHSETPRLDAELLLAACLEKSRAYLYSRPEQSLKDDCWQRFQSLIEERIKPTPVAYLLGQREFYSLEFNTSPAALIPRPETELIVEQALEYIPQDTPCHVLDLGTGTGNIAITIQKLRPNARLLATDIDPECLELARRNAEQHAVEIEFLQSNWYDNIDPDEAFDLILSNPPYIAAAHPFMAQGDLPAEPRLALSPGHTGLEALETIILGAARYLKPNGWVIVEHGYDQQAGVAALFAEQGFDEITCSLDLNDLPRTSRAKLVEKDGGTA